MEICFFSCFMETAICVKQAHGLLSQEEKKLKKTPGQEHRSDVLWNCFKEQCSSKETVLNTEAVWHLIYFATFRDRQFLNVEWRPLFEYIVAELGEKCEAMVFHETGKYLHEWLMHVPAKKGDHTGKRFVYRNVQKSIIAGNQADIRIWKRSSRHFLIWQIVRNLMYP